MSEVKLYFDPDLYPDNTLKKFNEFTQSFKLRYEAQYPDPPKVSMDAAIERWKLCNPDRKLDMNIYDEIRSDWISHDMVTKLIGIFSSPRFYDDWQTALPSEKDRQKTTWNEFVTIMQSYYEPTENLTLKNFQFRSIFQGPNESFPAFCNRVEKEAKHCNFKCADSNCTSERIAIRDQIIIGTSNVKIREEALKQSWDLKQLRREGMQIESALHGVAELSGEASLNKIGRFSKRFSNQKETQKPKTCYFCGFLIKSSIIEHVKICKAKKSKCNNCNKIGHYEQVCRSKKVNEVDHEEKENDIQQLHTYYDNYGADIFTMGLLRLHTTENGDLTDFRTQIIINKHLGTVLVDTGAKVSACSETQAVKWGLCEKMEKTRHKIKPFNSPPVSVKGIARGTVTHAQTSIPVDWYVLEGSFEPILSGSSAKQLGIIQFTPQQQVFRPVNMIESEDKEQLQDVLSRYPQNFQGLGKLKNHQIRLHVDDNIKPVAESERIIPYHLQHRVDEIISEMIDTGVIEEHPTSDPAPWISNIVVAPKPDGSLRMTLDARNINKAIKSTNLPIPRQEDIKAKIRNAQVFSKMDFRSAFWQLELHPESRFLTTFYVNTKLYRYKRLTMGIKPAQGELNTALRALFAHIPYVHLIHDDLIIAAPNADEHVKSLEEVMRTISEAGITLNAKKCTFGKPEIKFWGLIISKDGIRTDPNKVAALDGIDRPKTKEELISFICMMQSNADFIPNFAKEVAVLRDLNKNDKKFEWEEKHQKAFENLISKFKKETLLQYFDTNKQTYLFTDAHQSGFGVMLAQGECIEKAKPVALASRTTNKAEKHYPQIDLEAMGIDLGLRRFRNYIIGAPKKLIVVTDHQPLCSIFNGNRKGSIRTERIKLRHQDVDFEVIYQKGKINQADYLSRHALSLEKLPAEQQSEAEEMNKLLFLLHSTPVIDCIGIKKICNETKEDDTLKMVALAILKGKQCIKGSCKVEKFNNILGELTLSGNGMILKGERIILPEKLHELAIELAHRGAHPGQSGLMRRLRNHFFFHDMDKKVKEFVQKCDNCNSFVNKKTMEPLKPHKVPEKCWEKVAVDLFGPMPSSRHVVVVQDLGSKFPAAKLVSSTAADKVIPALSDVYNNYGNPDTQISDNGPPFNSKKMQEFADQRDIQMETVPPYHPSSNPVETFMRPLGKSLKIGNINKESEQVTLQKLLDSYRQTPHPATGISPASMMFRDGMKLGFPRKTVNEEDVMNARARDRELKDIRNREINLSKYRKKHTFRIGDKVLAKNHNRNQKFDTLFHSKPFRIIGIDEETNKIVIMQDQTILVRHPDDLKPYFNETDEFQKVCPSETLDKVGNYAEWPDYENLDFGENYLSQHINKDNNQTLRRSCRQRKPNTRYNDYLLE